MDEKLEGDLITSLGEIARIFKVSKRTILRYYKSEAMPIMKRGQSFFALRSELREWLKKRK